jgi:hypothetical protein
MPISANPIIHISGIGGLSVPVRSNNARRLIGRRILVERGVPPGSPAFPPGVLWLADNHRPAFRASHCFGSQLGINLDPFSQLVMTSTNARVDPRGGGNQ